LAADNIMHYYGPFVAQFAELTNFTDGVIDDLFGFASDDESEE
jgi:hypothetical protein